MALAGSSAVSAVRMAKTRPTSVLRRPTKGVVMLETDYALKLQAQRRALNAYVLARQHGIDAVSPADRDVMRQYLPNAERELADRAVLLNRAMRPLASR